MDVSLPLVAALGLVVIVGAFLLTRRRGGAVESAAVERGSAVAVEPAAAAEGSPASSATPPGATGSASEPATPPFDSAEALELCGGDPEFLKTVFAEVPKECRERIADLRAALAAGDAAAQRAAAHRMKGSLLLIAARPAAELARRLELAGAAGEAGPAELVDSLERALDELYAALARA